MKWKMNELKIKVNLSSIFHNQLFGLSWMWFFICSRYDKEKKAYQLKLAAERGNSAQEIPLQKAVENSEDEEEMLDDDDDDSD